MKRTFVYSLKLDSVGLSAPSQRDDENSLPICMGQRTTEKSIINIALSESESVLVSQLCLTLCNRMDWSPLDSSVHGIFQTRILK